VDPSVVSSVTDTVVRDDDTSLRAFDDALDFNGRGVRDCVSAAAIVAFSFCANAADRDDDFLVLVGTGVSSGCVVETLSSPAVRGLSVVVVAAAVASLDLAAAAEAEEAEVFDDNFVVDLLVSFLVSLSCLTCLSFGGKSAIEGGNCTVSGGKSASTGGVDIIGGGNGVSSSLSSTSVSEPSVESGTVIMKSLVTPDCLTRVCFSSFACSASF